ncbi:HutD family protein [Luteimonas yindakuii]|uniref:HutD family protein n=1 Tax=Luteimonas yindakuii TaxID=2565782 RepID=A0A4Z1R1S0_9GAMM|nr:HutD family protein [Luteimonas yindakuii]TKS53452.1 HutD family protein [Luteimonas yindakuii]
MDDTAGSRVIPANEYIRSRWRNGRGWTREICAVGGADGRWDWRLSIADIEQAGPYSPFPDTGREQVLLQGEGLELSFPDGRSNRLQPPYGRIRFDGSEPPHATPDGRVEVFNLIWRAQAVEVDLWHRPLVGPMLFFADADTRWALHLLAGQARFEGGMLPPLAQGDTAILDEPLRRRFLLDGGGELLAIRIRPHVPGTEADSR